MSDERLDNFNEDIENDFIDENPQQIQENNDVVVDGYENITYEEPTEIPNNEKTKKENPYLKKVTSVIALAVLFGVVAGVFGAVSGIIAKKYANSMIKIESTQSYLTKSEGEDVIYSRIAEVSEQCMPSVVSITNKGITEIMTLFGRYAQESSSSGSGIIIGKNDTELLIVTNYHVVADSTELSVLFGDEEKIEEDGIDVDNPKKSNILKANVKGYNSDKDLAVISVNLDDMSQELLDSIRIATIGDSSKIRAGEQVIAIGNALGYGQSVTTGIISAKNREVTLENQQGYGVVTNSFIQTDAAINPGNSGGALLNMNGELIGINSVKISVSGVEGMGYAIPISDVEEIIGELMVRETRTVVDADKQGFLGITGEDVTSTAIKAYSMPAGVFVTSVTEGLAADKAGIKKGYIITRFDNYTVTSISQLQERLTYYKAGEQKTITVAVNTGDGYEERELAITLGSKAKDSQKTQEQIEKEQNR